MCAVQVIYFLAQSMQKQPARTATLLCQIAMDNFRILCNKIFIVRNMCWDCSKDVAAFGISFSIQRATIKI